MNNILNDAEKLLADLSGYGRFSSAAKQLKQDLVTWRKEKFKEWCQDTSRAIDDPSQALRFPSAEKSLTLSLIFFSISSLETTGRLMELDARDGKLRVLYGVRLTSLISEVRQLSSLGYEIPPKISKCVDVGKKFYQYNVELQAVNETNATSLSSRRNGFPLFSWPTFTIPSTQR